jgi:IS4 transposase
MPGPAGSPTEAELDNRLHRTPRDLQEKQKAASDEGRVKTVVAELLQLEDCHQQKYGFSRGQ